MIARRVLFLILVLGGAVALAAQAQDPAEVQTREADEGIKTFEARERAATTLLTTADELRNSGKLIEAARTLNRAGRFQFRLHLPEDALVTFTAALKLVEQQSNIETQIESLNGLATAFYLLGKCDLAQSRLEQAITLSKQAGYIAGEAEALLTLSDCQNYSNHELALSTARAALGLWRSLDDKRGTAEANNQIGYYELTQNDLTEASQSFTDALALWRELKATDQQAEALINLGFIEYRKGAWQESLALYTQAQNLIDEKSEPYKMGQILSGLAESFIESGLPEIGLAKYRQALAHYRLAKNPRAIMATHWGIGKAQYLLGNYTEALVSLQIARADADAIKESTLMAMCNDFLGRTYLALNQPETALSHLQLALNGYLATKNPMELARTQALLGQVCETQRKIEQARNNYQTSLTTFRRLSDHVNESATLYALGRLELQQNNLDAAEDYLRQSIDATEDIRRVSTSSDLTAAFSATVQERYESYIECLMRKHAAQPGRGLEVRAFETSESARARSLTELLRATQTNLVPGLDPQLAEQEKTLRQSLRVKEDYKVVLLGQANKTEELRALEKELTDLELKYKQVTETIRARHPSFDQLSRPRAWSLSQLQDLVIIDDQTVLLEYSLGSERSYAWAVTRNSIRSYELPARSHINEAAQRVYELLATGADGGHEAELTLATRALSEMVLSPVAAELNKQKVIVVADGALNYIPFQILSSSTGSNEPLVASAEVINAPSASILGELRRETANRPAPQRVLAAFGDPIFASNYKQRKDGSTTEQISALAVAENERWQHALRDIEPGGDSFNPDAIQPLFYSTRELANLREVAGADSVISTGFAATRENLAAADLTKFAILHFATHGVLDPKRPENSGLFLSMVNRQGQAQNGFVGLQDIYSLHAPVDLVVLSACRTGLGKDVRGEGLIGLTRGFMYAGASSVLASLWKVDDEATSELMKRFYANMLQGGMNPAAALRAAQNSIRRQPQWRSPYYWAAFTLQGEYRQVIKPASGGFFTARVQIVLGLSLLLLLAGVAWCYGPAKQNPAR
jgi:CHAT domain-containing protein